MLTEANFKKYEPIVVDAVGELFEFCLKKEVRPNEFLIFLENGHFDSGFQVDEFSPYLIGQGTDGVRDQDRMAFVELFINIPFEKTFEKAKSIQEKLDVRRNSTALSMMVYTHFWESKVFLRKLRLLALLSQGLEYNWHLVCRPKNTYQYIKDEIREVFKTQKLKIYDVIKQAYRSQIRNAFAHSDYHLSDNKVYLNNFDPADKWSIEYVTWEEFDEIIIKTLLIYHGITKKTEEYKNKLGIENPNRKIYVPAKGGEYRFLHFRPAGSTNRWLWPNQL